MEVLQAIGWFFSMSWDFFTEVEVPGFGFSFAALFVGLFLAALSLRLGKRITKKITLTEATAEGESRIAEFLAFCPFWNWTLTLIPRYAKHFDSHIIPSMPELPYKEVPMSIFPITVVSGNA